MLVSKNKKKKACAGAFPFLPCPRARKQGHVLRMNKLQLNIGLSSKEFGVIHPETALNELRVQGFEILSYRVQEATCKDGAETCLSARVGLPDDWQNGLAFVADKLGQDCIAFAGFTGARPYASFDGLLWVPVDEKESPVEFETEERLFRAIRNGDIVETWEHVLSSPDTGEDLQEQAFNGLQDAGILDA